jgi:hypothetical protein
MHSAGRARLARLIAAVALMLVLYAWGKEDENGQAAASASVPECAPPLYDEIAKDTAYPDRAVAAARAGDFNLQGNKLHLEPPINWDQNPNRSTSFQGKLNDLTWIDPLLFAYRNGDTAALEQARDIVLDWIEGNPFANPYALGNVRGDSKPWIDKVSAARVQFIAYVAAAAECEGMLDDQQRETMDESLKTHGDFLADEANYHQTNHGLYVDRGLYLLAALAQLPESREWADLAAHRFTRTVRLRMVGGEGFWLEHSAQYQLAIDRLVDEFLELTGNEEPRLRKVAKAMRLTSGWMIEPDDEPILYGDSNVHQPSAAELAAAHGYQGVEFLPKTGLAFVRRQDPAAYLAMISSFHSDAHKDADELSFDLYDAGNRIVSDTGLYHKDLDEYFTFQDSPQAHSGLQVDGAEVPIVDSNSFGSGLYAAGSGGGWYAVWGTNPLLQQLGVDHRRLWVYRPGFALLVVDLVRSETSHTYERYIQLGPEIEASDEGEESLRLSAPGLDASLTSNDSTPGEVSLVRGEEKPLGGFVFPRFREAVPRYTATFTNEASDLDAVMSFGLDPERQVSATLLPEPSDESLGLRLQADGTDLGTILVTRSKETLGVAVSPELEGESLPKKVAGGG